MDDRDFPGHGEDRALGRGVGDLRSSGTEGRYEAGHIDDRPSSRLPEIGNPRPATARHAFNVDVQDQIPDFVRGVHDAVVVTRRDAGVVVENIDLAERLLGAGIESFYLRG